MYVPYCLNAILGWYKRFSKKNKKYSKTFYNQMKECFIDMTTSFDISDYRNYADVNEIKTVLNHSHLGWKYFNVVKRIFSIKKSRGRYIVCLGGIKISF